MKSKWFEFDGKVSKSKEKARNLKEAWDKTLEKWQLRMDGLKTHGTIATCGLCNLYREDKCRNCPIMKMTGESHCVDTPLDNSDIVYNKIEPALEYLFLLFVKEATYKGRSE